MIWKIIGICAALLTMFGFLPQVIKVARSKSAKDVSIVTILQIALGVFLWIIYGIGIKDAVIVIANSVTLISLLVLVYLYYLYEVRRRYG